MNAGFSTLSVRLDADHIGWRLDRALADCIPTMSRERLKSLISAGHVRGVAGPIRNPSAKITTTAHFEIDVPDPVAAHNIAQDIALDIVFEDDHLLIVDKPAGLVVHPAAGNYDGTLST